jgi:hypothetical protein
MHHLFYTTIFGLVLADSFVVFDADVPAVVADVTAPSHRLMLQMGNYSLT